MKHMVSYEIIFQYIKFAVAPAFHALSDVLGDMYYSRKE
jgi:hypothetical protein